MTREDLKKLQNTQLNILKDVVRVCNENDIKYYAAFGTLLGTIRHKGSIPWDNDIDIMMTREEFNKFILVKNQLPDHLIVGFLDTDNVDLVCEARVSNTKTLQYGINHQSRKGNVSIDIFILDYAKILPSWLKKIKIKYAEILRFYILDDFEREWLYDLHKSSKLKTLFLKLTEIIGKHYKKDNVLKRIRNMIITETHGSFMTSLGDNTYTLFDVEDLQEIVDMKYEDINISVPNGYDRVLTNCYGDYMQLPPEEKRFTAHLDDFVVEYLDE